MERFLDGVRAWRHDPEVVFSIFGAAVGTAGILLFLAGIFPLSPVNFWFFTILLVSLGLYRPNWCFLLLVAVVPFEIIAVSPESFFLSLRPYQWIFLALSVALGVRVLSGRSRWPLFTVSAFDYVLALIPLGALVSGVIGGGQGIRLGIIVVTFYFIYLLSRIFLKSAGDVRIAVATLFASGLMTALYGIAQNIAFERGVVLQSVMPGRPNALFAEPDWLGFFMALLLIIGLSKLAAVIRRSSEDLSHNLIRILLVAFLLLPIVSTLVLTVSRSAWLAAMSGVFVWASSMVFLRGKESIRMVLQSIQTLLIISVIALVIVIDIPLTRFDLFNRAESTATGLQEITVACAVPTGLPETIGSVEELAAYGCRHINLEERDSLRSAGLSIQTVSRPDPNVAIRSEIYARTWAEIKAHPVVGIGWGNIGPILGTDENGSAYNASNVWLEIILGAGVVGLLGLLGMLGLIIYQGFLLVHRSNRSLEHGEGLSLTAAYVIIFFVFNLFNAGLLIGLVWLAFAALVPLFSTNMPDRKAV